MVHGLEPMAGLGFWGKHLKHVSFSHGTVETRQGEGLLLQESEDIDIHALHVRNLPADTPGVILDQIENAYIHGCRDLASRKNFVDIRGEHANNSICVSLAKQS